MDHEKSIRLAKKARSGAVLSKRWAIYEEFGATAQSDMDSFQGLDISIAKPLSVPNRNVIDPTMYEFQGVFTRQNCSTLPLDPGKFTLRDLWPTYPFWGIRAHPVLNEAGSNLVSLEEATRQMIEAGLTSGLALSYATFGGPIEHLAGFEIQDSVIVEKSRFDSVSDSMDEKLLHLFIVKMSEYGIPPEEDGFFFPFERDFWGE